MGVIREGEDMAKGGKTKSKGSGKKYFEHQSPAFMVRALVLVILGVWALVRPSQIIDLFVLVIALGLCVMGIIELARVLHARRGEHNWGMSLAIAILEIAIGLFLLIFQGTAAWLVGVALGGLLLVRGVFDISAGFVVVKETTTRIIFLVSGLAGIILGLCVLAFPEMITARLIWIVGLYAVLVGIADFVLAVSLLPGKAAKKKIAKKK